MNRPISAAAWGSTMEAKSASLLEKVSVKCASGDAGLLYDLPQRGTLKAFL